jgi:protein O-GlcNAc transferase
LHKLVAEQHSHNIFKNSYNKNKNKVKNKIKIGYFSAEFHQHPVLQLMMDVYKNHNKNKFEVYGFSHDPEGENNYRNEAKGYFDKFIDITKMNDDDVVKLCRKMEIDIAINLTGHTFNARDDIFYHHVAPIQINYLGYPGTLGSKVYDYIIADKIILPKEFEKNYSEKVLHLPNCYQPNQTNREISKKNFRKEDFNLPKDSFVFGCFNNSYKITPNIFNCWMKILKKSENSVLWLLQTNNIGRENLKKESIKNGVDSKRIIFTDRVSVEEHLRRIGLIDLFLDTYPYNAHTTAGEAIKMGVPILTLIGESFASRVASSLLKNVGLEELIVNNINDYTEVAIKIASDKKKLQTLKNHLSKADNTKKLFNSEKFTKDLEEIYKNISK